MGSGHVAVGHGGHGRHVGHGGHGGHVGHGGRGGHGGMIKWWLG